MSQVLSAFGYLSLWFYGAIIKHSGVVMALTIASVRKVATIVLSVCVVCHDCSQITVCAVSKTIHLSLCHCVHSCGVRSVSQCACEDCENHAVAEKTNR